MTDVPPLEDAPFAQPPRVFLGANEKAFLFVLAIAWVSLAATMGTAPWLAYAGAIVLALGLALALLRRAMQRRR